MTDEVTITIESMEDNNFDSTTHLTLKDNKLTLFIHGFRDDDEIELWTTYSEAETAVVFEALGAKTIEEAAKALQENFSQRPKEGVFVEDAYEKFIDFCNKLGIKGKRSSWSS